jgi:hypothetical protein
MTDAASVRAGITGLEKKGGGVMMIVVVMIIIIMIITTTTSTITTKAITLYRCSQHSGCQCCYSSRSKPIYHCSALQQLANYTSNLNQTTSTASHDPHPPDTKLVATSADVFIENEKFLRCSPLCPPNMMMVCKFAMPSMLWP